MELPLFFPSISSVKTNFSPLDYLKLIKASKHPNFLVSAYDIYNQDEKGKSEMIEMLNGMKEEGRIILLDSGNYESYWHKDSHWSIDKYNEILKNEFCSFCFSFDYQRIEGTNRNDLVKIITESTYINQSVTGGVVAPIVHAKPEDLEYVCCNVLSQTNPQFIAIPERLLGGGIINRVLKLRQIRVALNELGYYTPIHLLGTGNPFSLLLFAYTGADTFDGLEWCQTCIDMATFQVYHFQLRELFRNEDADIKDYDIATLLNNLNAYREINRQIKDSITNDNIQQLLEKHFSTDVINRIRI
jgi:queuine/archaeosine tRNA-ribosyltransferase